MHTNRNITQDTLKDIKHNFIWVSSDFSLVYLVLGSELVLLAHKDRII